jgi:hypothetical protein
LNLSANLDRVGAHLDLLGEKTNSNGIKETPPTTTTAPPPPTTTTTTTTTSDHSHTALTESTRSTKGFLAKTVKMISRLAFEAERVDRSAKFLRTRKNAIRPGIE